MKTFSRLSVNLVPLTPQNNRVIIAITVDSNERTHTYQKTLEINHFESLFSVCLEQAKLIIKKELD